MQPLLQDHNRIGIVGLGLIGGSLALDLQHLGHKVYGVAHRPLTVERAKERGLAEVISTDYKILTNCSIVILALPLSQLIKPTKELINALPKQAIITDVGSVKAPIQAIWNKLHPRFIPSHPMAGTAKTGVEAGQKNLFEGRPWITTPCKDTDNRALEIVQNLAISIGSKFIVIDAETHDKAVALISHLPLLVSAALLKTVAENTDSSLLSLSKVLASSGFSDTTRVGGGNPKLGVDIAKNNSQALLKALYSYRQSIEKLEALVESKQWEELQKELEQSQAQRPEFL